MTQIRPLAGTAAGIGVFVQNVGAALFSQLYGFIADGTVVPMVIIVACAGVLGLASGAMPLLAWGTPPASKDG
jgi:hypothetical protein